MNKKYIEGVVLFVLLAMFVLGGAWLYSRNKEGSNLRGKYTFAETRDKINYLGGIKIVSPDNGEISMYRLSDGSWRFKEAKEYFVNEEMLSSFFKMIKSSIILSVVEPENDFTEKNNLTAEKGITLKTYDYEGNLLDDVILGGKIGEDQIWLMRPNKKSYAYVVSEVKGISDFPQDWLPYPLLSIETAAIKSVSVGGEKTDYNELGRKIKRSAAWRNLVRSLNFLEYYGLTFKSDLADLPDYAKIRQIDIKMLNGMIYKLTAIYVDNAYWIVISMDADNVFMADAVNVAANTYRYYADWVFRLSDEQGKAFFDEAL